MSFSVMNTRCLDVRWCINAAVLFTVSRQDASFHAAARGGDARAVGSAVPHTTNLLHQSAEHG